MEDFIHAVMGPIPGTKPMPTMDLVDIIGKSGIDDIENAGSIRFHAVGDTGRSGGDSKPQDEISDAMAADYKAGRRDNPAFFFHLGDVIYGHRKELLYRDEFYRPYMKYPGKILAIPGNHDGEIYADTDPKPLQAFLDNFCASKAVVPKIAADVRIFRETMTQPGVYWLLRAPFVNIIGLYSNIAEGPGDLLGDKGDDKQIQFLKKALSDLKTAQDGGEKKALVIATHHPPFSQGGHSGSTRMLEQIDAACIQADIVPHAMLAGHAHNFQRYTRTIKKPAKAEIPCVVAGCGGHNDQSVKKAKGQKIDDAVFVKSMQGYGYIVVSATKKQLSIEMIDTTKGTKRSFDKVTVDIATHRLV
jgi:hypothetical protein